MFAKTVDGNGTDMLNFRKDELVYTTVGKCKTLNGRHEKSYIPSAMTNLMSENFRKSA
jgi:hypothetical protein